MVHLLQSINLQWHVIIAWSPQSILRPDSLWAHGLQHARPHWPSPTPRARSNSRPSSRWCHPTISSSVVSFSSNLQSQHQGLFQWVRSSHQVAKGLEFSDVLTSHSVQFSCSVVSDSLWPHESQCARPPCPSPTPGVHPNPCPSSRWCHPAISSSVVPFSSCP